VEQQTELIAVHQADNGVIEVIPDSGVARAGKTALMTLGTGPIGFAAGVLTREMRAECSKCRKVFARSTYSLVLKEKMEKLIDKGEIVIRSYTPPPIPEYDSAEVHAPARASVEAEIRTAEIAHRRAEQAPYTALVWSLFLSAMFWGVVYLILTDHFQFDYGHVASLIFTVAIASLLTRWFIHCCKCLRRQT